MNVDIDELYKICKKCKEDVIEVEELFLMHHKNNEPIIIKEYKLELYIKISNEFNYEEIKKWSISPKWKAFILESFINIKDIEIDEVELMILSESDGGFYNHPISVKEFVKYFWDSINDFITFYESNLKIINIEDKEGNKYIFDLDNEEIVKEYLKEILKEINKEYENKNDKEYNEIIKKYNSLKEDVYSLNKKMEQNEIIQIKKEIKESLITFIPLFKKVSDLILIPKKLIKLIEYKE